MHLQKGRKRTTTAIRRSGWYLLAAGLILTQVTNGFHAVHRRPPLTARHRFLRHPLSVPASTRAEGTADEGTAEERNWLNRKMGGKIKVGLMVEPTPFTHVSGYANRFNEMLKNLRKAGDDVEVITPDNEDNGAAPQEVHGHRVNNLKGFKFPMYPLITLTFDLKARAISIMNRFRPDILHVSTPSFICFMGILASRVLSIPLVLSYHTHLPVYARNYGNTSTLWRFMGPVSCSSREKAPSFLRSLSSVPCYLHWRGDLAVT